MNLVRKALPLLATAVALLGAQPANAQSVFANPDFESRIVVDGLDFPTAVAWAPDGRMFIVEKKGALKVLNPGETQADDVLDISGIVGDEADRGMLGVAVDASYPTNNYVYLLYSRDTGIVLDDAGPMVSQLARYTITPANVVTDGTVILGTHVPTSGGCPAPSDTLDCIPSDSETHSIGSVRAAADGTLWVGAGDGADYGGVDPLAYRTYDDKSYAGKVLHVSRDGLGLAGHPLCPADGNLAHVCTKVFAEGFRNPFRFHLRPGGLAVGDVGWNTREELDLLRFDQPGKSYGWPCYEGTIQTPGYKDGPECAAEYAQPPGTHLGPAYDYPHTPPLSNAVQSGPFYDATNYPEPYQDKLFLGDYAAETVDLVTIEDHQVTDVEPFATALGTVDLELAPSGNITYSAVFAGRIEEIVYTPGARTPNAVAAADPSFGSAPLDVQLTGSDSSDPDSEPLDYDWDFGDGTPNSNEADPSHTYATPGNYTATLTVTDPTSRTDSDSVEISAGNDPPSTPSISNPADESLYRDGQTIAVAGSASDPQDGALDPSALTWTVTLHHGSHSHPVLNQVGLATTSFETSTDHDSDSYYDITLTAEDSGGLSSSRTIQIRPETVTFGVESSPSGAPISYAGVDLTAPFSTQAAIGFQTSVSAAQQFTQTGHTWDFESWSDGGARLHNLTVPASPTTLTATYNDVTPGNVTITKQTDPVGSSRQFDFTGGLGAFTLSGATGSNSHSVQVAAGTYAVTESALAGWDLTQLVCSDGSATSGRTATIDVSPGENVTCVFSNTKESSVTITKQTDPAGSSEQFDFGGGLGAFSLSGATGSNSHSVQVDPGTYAVTEAAKAGWDLTQLTCTDGSPTGGQTATISVSVGEDVTCVFRNTRQGTITIVKQTDPAGSTEDFDFSGDGPLGSFALSEGEAHTVSVAPGSYSVTEVVKAGWDLTQLSCSDGSATSGRTATIGVSIAENVTCTYRNTEEGSITIEKQTQPDGATDRFDFSGDAPLGSFALSDGQEHTVALDPGSYAVSEVPKPGWDLTQLACSDGTAASNGVVSIGVAGGEAVRCVFTNTERGRITVSALTDPAEDPPAGIFSFTGDPPLDSFALGPGQSREQEAPPGTYAVRQGATQGYTLAAVGCDDADSTGSAADREAIVRLAAGEAVACIFTTRPEADEDGTSETTATIERLSKRRGLLVGSTRDADRVERLQVAIGRAVAGHDRCRWWSKKAGRLPARPRRCTRPRWMLAELEGSGEERSWRVRLGGRLPPGRYRILLLAIDGLGDRSKLRLTF